MPVKPQFTAAIEKLTMTVRDQWMSGHCCDHLTWKGTRIAPNLAGNGATFHPAQGLGDSVLCGWLKLTNWPQELVLSGSWDVKSTLRLASEPKHTHTHLSVQSQHNVSTLYEPLTSLTLELFIHTSSSRLLLKVFSSLHVFISSWQMNHLIAVHGSDYMIT